jgi:hypothetical protein
MSNQPAYRAAADTAHAELRQISDRLNQLRIRQEQIYTAVQALKLLVTAQDVETPAGRPATSGRPVYTMNGRTPQTAEEAGRVRALA